MCMYVCMYIYIYIHIHTYIHIHNSACSTPGGLDLWVGGVREEHDLVSFQNFIT